MNKALPFLSATLLCLTSAIAQDKPCGKQRIPIAVGSDFQLEPVCANIPEQKQPEIKLIGGFEPDQAKNPLEAPARLRKPNKDRDVCITDASKRPTDTGVRVALSECYKKYGTK